MRGLVLLGMIMFLAVPAFAQEADLKGASEQAYENASDKAVFNRVSDWFSTVGKSEEEKEQVLAERKAVRAEKRERKELRKVQKNAERETNRARGGLEDDSGKAENKMREINQNRAGFKSQGGDRGRGKK